MSVEDYAAWWCITCDVVIQLEDDPCPKCGVTFADAPE